LKCVEVAKQSLGDLHSVIELYLQTSSIKRIFNQDGDIDESCYQEKENILNRNELKEAKELKLHLIPSIEIRLSKVPLDTKHPGYQKPGIRVQPLISNSKFDYGRRSAPYMN
jgi:hypothetical protein